MASPAAWVLCLFALVGCGEEDAPVSAPEARPRALVLSGQVVDARDAGVEGADVFLAQEDVPWESMGPGPVEPVEMRRVLVGKTDAEGHYAVTAPGPGKMDRYIWLTARHPDFAFSGHHDPLVVGASVSAQPGPTLRVFRSGAVAGRVEDAQGIGLPEVEVVLRSPFLRGDFRAKSGLDGVFHYPSVPEGPVRVRLADGDDTELEVDVVPSGEVSLPESLLADPAKGDG